MFEPLDFHPAANLKTSVSIRRGAEELLQACQVSGIEVVHADIPQQPP